MLAAIDPLSSSAVLIHRGGGWFSSSLDVGSDSVPAALLDMAQSGRPGTRCVDGPSGEVVVVGMPLRDVSGELFEVATLDDLVRSLSMLGFILTVGTVIAAAAGVGIGVWSSAARRWNRWTASPPPPRRSPAGS